MKQNANVVVTGTNVILVPYGSEHVSKYHGWMESAELRELTASERLGLDEEHKMQERWRQDEDKCTFIVLDAQLHDRTCNEVASMIGDTNLFLNDENRSVAEIEIMIAEPEFRGKGRGREALLLMMTYGFRELGIRKYVAKIGLKNDKSLRLFKDIGFETVSSSDVFHEVTLEKVITVDTSECGLTFYDVSVKPTQVIINYD